MLVAVLTALLAVLPTARAQSGDDDASEEVVVYGSGSVSNDMDAAEEIVVWGDLFARWDGTRWMITTEVGVPFPFTLARDENEEFQTSLFQVRAIFACDKDFKLGRRRFEVSCEVEDIGIKAAIAQRKVKQAAIERAQRVLDEVDAKLTGVKMQLQVADDGRVTNVDMEGVPARTRRMSNAQETLRQIMSRLVAGYNLKMQKWNQLHEGKWVEYNSTIMHVPVPSGISGNLGSNMIVHYLNRFKGHVIVQSIGKGMTVAQNNNFEIELIGVSIFDDQDGFMTERVWALNGKSTASTFFTTQQYFHAGRITLLGEKDRPSCGTTEVVNAPNQHWPGLSDWVPIERPNQ